MIDQSSTTSLKNTGLQIPSRILRFQFARSSGPGGQNVNKRSTKVTLNVTLDDLRQYIPAAALERLKNAAGHQVIGGQLSITSETYRYQSRNRQDCIARLAELIKAALVRPKRRKPTRKPAAARERRIKAKKHRAETKRLRGRVEP